MTDIYWDYNIVRGNSNTQSGNNWNDSQYDAQAWETVEFFAAFIFVVVFVVVVVIVAVIVVVFIVVCPDAVAMFMLFDIRKWNVTHDL